MVLETKGILVQSNCLGTAEGFHPALEQLHNRGDDMKTFKSFKLVIALWAFALIVGLGGHLLIESPPADAARLFRYKVVAMEAANTVYEYEKLLNDMAYQGWTFDHMIVEKHWAIFKK